MAASVAAWFLLLNGLIVLSRVSSHSDGAPADACSDMRPQHFFYEPSRFPPPFTITVSPMNFSAGQPVRVTIRMDAGKKFKGFMILSRRANVDDEQENRPVGSFREVAGTQHVCEGYGLTHTKEFSDNPRSELTVEWSLPASTFSPFSVQFRVTVVEQKETFWVDERSPVVYDNRLTPTTTPRPSAAPEFVLDVTDGCRKTKSCYRNPPACSEPSCDIVVTWKKLSDRTRTYEFEMSANTEGWVALGFSDDKKMGDDDVVECVRNVTGSRPPVNVRLSQNIGKQNVHNKTHLTQSQSELQMIYSDHSKGRLRCRFRRRLARNSVLLQSDSHHLLVTKGPLTDNGMKKRHSLEPNKYPYVSPSMINIDDDDKVDISDTARYPLVKIHGCLMLIAWMMCASTALLLSKYYKRMWPNDKLCGTDVWFAVHRALMIICLILTVIAFIIIFIHVGGYSHMPDYPEKAHPPLGICVMILVILNPFITLFRCKTDSKYRPVFNWFHWLFGTVAYVLQLPAIFIGLNLHKAFVPAWATWVFTAFVLFHLIIELLLEIHGCLNARKQKRRDDDFERTKKTDFKGEYQGMKEEPVGHRFKKIILSIYLVVVIILGVLMVLAVAVG